MHGILLLIYSGTLWFVTLFARFFGAYVMGEENLSSQQIYECERI